MTTSIAKWLAVGAVVVFAGCADNGEPTERQFASESCKITFGHPLDWGVVADSSDPPSPCTFVVRPHDWEQRLVAADSVDLFTMRVQVMPGHVWAKAPTNGFARHSTGWVVLGRDQVATPADSFARSGLQGLRGIAQIGCYREGGTYFGLCDMPMAIVGTATKSVLVIAQPRADSVFDRTLATLRILP